MAKGFDPQWHPHKEAFIFSGARKLGRKTVQHDIKLMNMFKQSRWLTNTHATDERWPRWLHGATSLIYTVKNTTDIFTLNFENNLMKEGLFVLASLFTVRTPTAEKIKILDQYFTPKSGSLLKVDSDSNLDAQSHFLDAPLHLKVAPQGLML